MRTALVDAQAVADALGVGRAFVYEHGDELGAIRLGNGRRARLRFNLEQAVTCYAGRKSDAPRLARKARSRTSRRRSLGTTVELLPIRGQIRGETAHREAA